jgi:hypothetical protein
MRYAPRHAVGLTRPYSVRGMKRPYCVRGICFGLTRPYSVRGMLSLPLPSTPLGRYAVVMRSLQLPSVGMRSSCAPYRSLRSIRGRHAVVMRFGLTRPYCGKGHALPSAPLGRYAVGMCFGLTRPYCGKGHALPTAPYHSLPLP